MHTSFFPREVAGPWSHVSCCASARAAASAYGAEIATSLECGIPWRGVSALGRRDERRTAVAVSRILPLSGRGREVGEAALHGLLLAVEQAGSKVRVVYRDDAGDPARAVAALEDLVSLHRAIAVIGPLTAGPAQAVVERAEALSVPVIALHPDAPPRAQRWHFAVGEPRESARAVRARWRAAREFAS